MARDAYDRQQRWRTAGYQSDREGSDRPAGGDKTAGGDRSDRGDWPGDRSRARNYDREDMRRYNQRSIEQSEKLRRLRGMQPDREDQSYGQYRRRIPARPPYREEPLRNIDPDHLRFESSRGYRADRYPWDDQVDNYWGKREQTRDLRRNYHPGDRPGSRRDWRSSTAGRPDVTSGRYYTNDLPTHPGDNWDDDREYDLDPGYDYEFGTDFDFMDQPGPEDARGRSQRRENWNVPGPFAGIGPQGYRPSDERITENVCETLSRSRQIEASGLRVQVENGVVMLSGSVNHREEKYWAEDIASSVAGVTEVENKIQVRGSNRSGN